MAGTGAKRSVRPPQERSGATQEALVTAAGDALREVGFAGASAREIARRAGCNQSQIFYHFGSLVGLLLTALDQVSARRMAAYSSMLESATTLSGLVESAHTILTEDLASGDVSVLVEMVAGAHSVPGLGDEVAARLTPWHELTEQVVRRAMSQLPLGPLVPAAEVAHALVAGLLGLELLANLSGDRAAATALFDRARGVALLLELTGAMPGMPAAPVQEPS